MTLLQVARPFQGPVFCKGYSSPMALNLGLPAFGASRDRAAPWRCRAVGGIGSRVGFGGVGAARTMNDGSVLIMGVGPAALTVPVSCGAVCQGPGQAGASARAEARPRQRGMPGQHRVLGRSVAQAGQSPAEALQLEAVRQPRASAGDAGAVLGAKGSLQSRGGRIYPTGMLWGLISLGQLGLGVFL